MQLPRLFTEHPASVGESYWEHFRVACSFAGAMLKAACACFIHALFPFLFTTTGSDIVKRLYGRMITHRVSDQHEND